MSDITPTLLNVHQKIEELLVTYEERKKIRDVTSEPFLLDLYELGKTAADKALWLQTATALTQFYCEISSEFEKAIKYILEILEQLDDDVDADEKSEFYRRLGLNYDYVGKLILAKQAYDKSISLLDNKPNVSAIGLLTIARSLFNLSIIYGDLGLNTLSFDFLNRAFNYFEKANYKPGISRCYISYGVEAYTKKEFEKSLDYYEKAIVIAEEINDTPPYCIAMGNCGIVNAEMGNIDKALACIQKSLTRVQNQTNKHFELSISQMAGRVYLLCKQPETSHIWFSKSELLSVEIGKELDNFELYKYWAETLNALDQHQEAYQKLCHFTQQREQLFNRNKEAELNDAMLRFRLEEGVKEQDFLKKKNAEIEQYANQLEISNYELKQFAYVASHDMKEPLRMISNYSQLLSKSLGQDLKIDQKDYLFYINDGAKRMMNVIQSLLQLSKINEVQNKSNVNMSEVLEEVKATLMFDLIEKNASIEHDPLPSVYADKIQILQLFQNLIGNAIKYNKSDTPSVKIQHKEEDTMHHFEISDNGIGIPAQYREKVFIIFQRLHGRNEFEGNGIGLSICKKIIDSLHGKIWIEDAPWGGTKICFTIQK